MEFKLNIKCDNAAFDTAPQYEVARILRDLAMKVSNQGTEGGGSLLDINGNKCGAAEFVDTHRGYSLWKCDDGSFDVVDKDGEVCFCNFGKDGDPSSAWEQFDVLEYELRGNMLIELLDLKPDQFVNEKPRYWTAWGSKTALGLFLSIKRIVKDGR